MFLASMNVNLYERSIPPGACLPACTLLEHLTFLFRVFDGKQIRVERWVAKLNGPYPLPNRAWRRNRNDFAALLVRAVEEVDFREPFNKRPPGMTVSRRLSLVTPRSVRSFFIAERHERFFT